jgi:NAD+ synthase (glutamine-hydrolysing)
MTDGLIADINPIGGISKTDLKRFIAYARDAFSLPVLDKLVAFKTMLRLVSLQLRFLNAVPTAELEPITETYVQADEVCPHL